MRYLSILTAELPLVAGLILDFLVLLAPTPWGSPYTRYSLLRFTPYIEPEGYLPPNPCPSYPLSNSTVNFVIPRNGGFEKRAILSRITKRQAGQADTGALATRSNADSYSNVAVWLGPLGSCSRDQDGSVHCSKASYNSPVYNLSYIQPNSVFYAARMPAVIERMTIMAIVALHVIGALFYALSSYIYWRPKARASAGEQGAVAALTGTGIYLFLIGIVCFFLNFKANPGSVNSYNSIDNFYDPAPCNQRRPLKSGILLRASQGVSYKVLWGAWLLIILVAGVTLIFRVATLNQTKSPSTTATSTTTTEKKKTKAEEDEFRRKIDEEKERIRRIAQIEVDLERKMEEKGARSDGSSTAASP